MATSSKRNLDELATSIVKCFPSHNLLEQRLSLSLYRLLAAGQPVPRTALAKQLEISLEIVNRILDGLAWRLFRRRGTDCWLLLSRPGVHGTLYSYSS